MMPPKVKALLAEVVTHRRREHHTEVDKAVREFLFKMVRQGNDRSSAFNDGKVRIYCEAFEKCAACIWEDMQRTMAGRFEVYPGCEDDLINFLKESLAAVCEADKKSLFDEKNVVVHTLIAGHLAQCKPRFEFHCRAVTEKLTTEIKIFVNQLRARTEKTMHEAVIEGRKCQVAGFDEQRNLVLADGQRYVFELLNFNPAGQPREEPEGDVFGWPLLEAVKLRQWGKSWEWNGEAQLLDQWVESEVKKLGGESQAMGQPEFFKRRMVKFRLDALPPVNKETVRGVAWFKHDDGAGGFRRPVLLKSFRLLPASAKPGVASDLQVGFIIRGKRFRHTPEFDYVQVGEELFDLRSRRMAKACLQYLVAVEAFDDSSARHIADDIDPQVRKVCGKAGLKYSTPKIDNYFANDRTGKLQRLRKELVRSAGKNGKFYLHVN